MKTLGPLPAQPLNPEQTVAQENYMWLNAELMVKLPGGETVAPGFLLRFIGEHSMEYAGAGLAFIL